MEVVAVPNPTSGILQISGEANINGVAVYDLLGKQVVNASYTAGDIEVDLSHLQAGAYILKAISNNGAVKTIKVFKN